jgi:hypothetical protein
MSDLFDSLREQGEPAILRLVSERTVENVVLDFKRKQDSTNGSFSKDDKTQFGRLLSGFANSAGGLGIWGVNASKGQDGLDCAQVTLPISDIERFRSEAETLCGQLLMPRHDGITLHTIMSSDRPGSGYLVVKVDRSERRPHRSEAAGDKRYYKRAGDSFFEMEHYDIEDAFRRTAAPSLSAAILPFNVVIQPDIHGRHIATFVWHITIYNDGDTLSRFPYLSLLASDAMWQVSQEHDLRRASPDGDWRRFLGTSDSVIHPGHSTLVVALRSMMIVGLDHILNSRAEYATEQRAFCMVKFGCEGMRQRGEEFTFSPEKLRDVIQKHRR